MLTRTTSSENKEWSWILGWKTKW